MRKRKDKEYLSGATVFAVFAVIFILLLKISEDPNPVQKRPTIKEKKIPQSREVLLTDSFSTFDGRHILFAHAVKKLLLDPSSFSHITTRYQELPNGIVDIHMIYRAKNSFGALTIHFVSATVHIDRPDVLLTIQD